MTTNTQKDTKCPSLSGTAMKILCLLVFVALLGACGGGGGGGSNQPPPQNPIARPSNTDCLAGDPPGNAGLRMNNAFPNLSFSQPLALIAAPSGNRLYVVERGGSIRAFDNDPTVTASSLFADISGQVATQGEGGLLGMAFDPDFANNGYVYLSYTAAVPADQQIANQRVLWSRISRFETVPDRSAIIPASEQILLQIDQPFTNHNGGQIAFDNSGLLFIGLGDGGSGNDPNQNAQDVTNLLGAMLRINPSMADTTRGLPYSIPTDNPFVGNHNCAAGGCPEIYAWGLRNPWRWSFDRATGQLWAGDVGQVNREEVDLIERGQNYGWGCYEGTRRNTDYSGNCPAQLQHSPPIHEYPRSDGSSITGGYVYRGSSIPSLNGDYVFADYGSGQVWALEDPYGNPQRRTLLSTTHLIASLGEDAQGELYLIFIDNGQIQRIEADPGSVPTTPFAPQLSNTGCADSANPKQPSSGQIHYDINVPFWSDNANKQRWLALPDNNQIMIQNDHDWDLPIGSVLRKDFYLNDQIIETRLLAHHNDGTWAGYSYEWNSTQTEATLLDSAKTVSVAGQSWSYPSPAQCVQCHTRAAGRALGLETAQLNRTITHPSGTGTINQLSYFEAMGLFNTAPGDPALAARLPTSSDTLATPEAHARAYLHTNCSHCHRPAGPAPDNMDLRYTTPLNAMNICNVVASAGTVLGATHRLTPGNLSDSILYQRLRAAAGSQRMPPLSVNIEDNSGLQQLANWIGSLAACP